MSLGGSNTFIAATFSGRVCMPLIHPYKETKIVDFSLKELTLAAPNFKSAASSCLKASSRCSVIFLPHLQEDHYVIEVV